MPIFFQSRTIDHGMVKSIWRRARQGLSDHMSPILMEDTPYFRSCCTVLENYCKIIFTRESGYHACGWWKNPLYDRCFHLSLSFMDQADRLRQSPLIVRAIYPDVDWQRSIWMEPPHSRRGKQLEVYHYRVMIDPNDPNWRTPICPSGEVYSKEWTGPEWKSWSELHGT